MTRSERAMLARNSSLALAALDFAGLCNTVSAPAGANDLWMVAVGFSVAIPCLVVAAVIQQLIAPLKASTTLATAVYLLFALSGLLASLIGIYGVLERISPTAATLFGIICLVSLPAAFISYRSAHSACRRTESQSESRKGDAS